MSTLVRPVPNQVTQTFSGAFIAERPGWLKVHGGVCETGRRRSPMVGGVFLRDIHLAIDYACPEGTPVKAMAAGPVIDQGIDTYSGNAWFVIQRIHRNAAFAYYMAYYHLKAKSLKQKVGDVLAQGEVLALSGNTGYSSGPHLHVEGFRLPRSAKATNPEWYLPSLRFDPQVFIDSNASLDDIR